MALIPPGPRFLASMVAGTVVDPFGPIGLTETDWHGLSERLKPQPRHERPPQILSKTPIAGRQHDIASTDSSHDATLRAVAVWLLVVLSSAAALSAEGQEQQRPARCQLSEASLTERIAAAYDFMQQGEFEDGYAKLRVGARRCGQDRSLRLHRLQLLQRRRDDVREPDPRQSQGDSGRRRQHPGNEGGRQGARRLLSQLCDRQARHSTTTAARYRCSRWRPIFTPATTAGNPAS